MAVIVTKPMIAQIRRRWAAGEKLPAIAKDLGIHHSTAWKYASDLNYNMVVANERRAYERAKENPETMERRRKAARAHMARLRAEERA